ncbi:MAG: hypothetical protein M1570_02190 [Chloroflexi bacterium]|nr:hypothetical protein [Chloroflexota bacterium]
MSAALLGTVCIGTGLAIRLMRRWPRLVFLSTFVGMLLLAVLLLVPSAPFALLGRTLVMDPAVRAFLALAIGVTGSLAFFGPLAFEESDDSPTAIIENSQGAFFFWSLALLILAIVVDSFPLAVFFWAIGLIILMLTAAPKREGRVGGAAQFLLLTVIASACLLLANRFVDLYPLTPENSDLSTNAVIFLALGFGLVLAAAPLHIWLGPLADEMPLLATAFLVGVAQPVGLWLLFQLMSETFWLTSSSPLLTVLMLGGGLTAPVGALLALSERRDGRLVAFLSLVTLGHALVGLGLGSKAGLEGAMIATLGRAIGVTLFAGGLAFVRNYASRHWQLVGAAAILAGGLTLAGIPPALGFASSWSIYHELVASNLALVVLLLASNGLVLLATLRLVWSIVGLNAHPAAEDSRRLFPILCTAVIAVLVLVVILLGVFPQWVADPFASVLLTVQYLK